MKININENKLVLEFEGKIDSSNASQVEEEIFSKIGNQEISHVDINCKNLEYISSAGLRIILKILKICKDIEVKDVSNEVYDIFEMTGFSEMMKVTKAYKEISIEGCEIIGRGACGKIYKIDNETIVKAYINPESLENIKRERELARAALILGVPTAISYDVVKIGQSYGSVFELLNAKSFSKLFALEDDHYDEYMDLYIDLSKTIHSKTSDNPILCDAKEKLLSQIKSIEGKIDSVRYTKLLKMANEIPEENTLLHGDYHIKNVMMQNDEVLLIDMDTLSRGNVIFEFAPMRDAYIGYEMRTKENTFFLDLTKEQCIKVYNEFMRRYYSDKSEEQVEAIKNKVEVVSCTRMLSFVYEDLAFFDNENGIKIYTDALNNAIDKVENLII